MQRPVHRIIILGTLRSGTSLTAELVRVWGAYAGESTELWQSDPMDQRGYGYMEYIPLQQLNDDLLDNNDRVPPPDGLMAEKASDPKYKKRALQLLHLMDGHATQNRAPSWVWKDARLPLTIPFWMEYWGDAIFIITVRHPAETVLSAARTEDFDPENLPFSAGFAYWQYCMLNILTYTQSSRRKIFIAYDQLIDKSSQECTRLCNFLDDQCGNFPNDSKQRIEVMLPQVSKSQRHYHYEKSLAEIGQATREQRALYDFLRVKTIYPNEVFNKDDFALYPGWREYLQAMDMLVALTRTRET